MKSKVYSLLLVIVTGFSIQAQVTLTGKVLVKETKEVVSQAEVYNKLTGEISSINKKGEFSITVDSAGRYPLVVFAFGYAVQERMVDIDGKNTYITPVGPFSSIGFRFNSGLISHICRTHSANTKLVISLITAK